MAKKLELSKPVLEALTLYANGLNSFSELVRVLDYHKVEVVKVNASFVPDCTFISSPNTDGIYIHLSRRSGEKDSLGFPIDDETCVVNL